MKLLKLLGLLSVGVIAFAPLACGDDEGDKGEGEAEAESEGEAEAESEGESESEGEECKVTDPDCIESGDHWCKCCAPKMKCDACDAGQTIEIVAPTLESTCGDFNALTCKEINSKGYCN